MIGTSTKMVFFMVIGSFVLVGSKSLLQHGICNAEVASELIFNVFEATECPVPSNVQTSSSSLSSLAKTSPTKAFKLRKASAISQGDKRTLQSLLRSPKAQKVLAELNATFRPGAEEMPSRASLLARKLIESSFVEADGASEASTLSGISMDTISNKDNISQFSEDQDPLLEEDFTFDGSLELQMPWDLDLQSSGSFTDDDQSEQGEQQPKARRFNLMRIIEDIMYKVSSEEPISFSAATELQMPWHVDDVNQQQCVSGEHQPKARRLNFKKMTDDFISDASPKDFISVVSSEGFTSNWDASWEELLMRWDLDDVDQQQCKQEDQQPKARNLAMRKISKKTLQFTMDRPGKHGQAIPSDDPFYDMIAEQQQPVFTDVSASPRAAKFSLGQSPAKVTKSPSRTASKRTSKMRLITAQPKLNGAVESIDSETFAGMLWEATAEPAHSYWDKEDKMNQQLDQADLSAMPTPTPGTPAESTVHQSNVSMIEAVTSGLQQNGTLVLLGLLLSLAVAHQHFSKAGFQKLKVDDRDAPYHGDMNLVRLAAAASVKQRWPTPASQDLV